MNSVIGELYKFNLTNSKYPVCISRWCLYIIHELKMSCSRRTV